MKPNIIISPRTKVYDLLETYPELEDTLIEIAPAFKKLKNPVLRNTIAKITSLQQAAAVGNMRVDELVNRLRREVGQDSSSILENDDKSSYSSEKPDWFLTQNIVDSLDVRPMLERGEHPVHEVLQKLKTLDKDMILAVISSFLPAPLIDKATSLGYKYWVSEKDEEFHIYFIKA